MRIMQASGECFPYSKTGGLADMVGALSKALASKGNDVQLVTPLYRGILKKYPDITKMEWDLDLHLGDRIVSGNVFRLKPVENLTIYFIDQPEFFDRPGIYGEKGEDYPDNAERFLFFSKAVANLARYLPEPPDILHAHDWQAGMAPVLVHYEHFRGGWHPAPKTCFTIHNLAYQGNFPSTAFAFSNLPGDYFSPHGVEFYNQLSFLKSGLVYADELTTVSPRYAREILTDEYSCGMTGVLQARADRLTGILNGVDYEDWNTTSNPNLDFSYDATDLKGKDRQKKKLLKHFGLPTTKKAPLLGVVGRLVDQKGGDLLLPALHATLELGYQFVLLGSGMPHYEEGFERLAKDFPKQVAVHIGYDNALAHKIEAASDFFLMPSKFEPCGLNQLYSLKYGTIPLVRAVGGLDDSVVGLDEDAANADGIKFSEYAVTALESAIQKAVEVYKDAKLFNKLRQNGMSRDFSWERTSKEYMAFYEKLIKG